MTRQTRTLVLSSLVACWGGGCGAVGLLEHGELDSGEDTEGPTIALDTPDAKGFAARDPQTGGLVLTGTVNDPSGIDRLTVNGIDIENPGAAGLRLPLDAVVGVNVLEVLAVDTLGNETLLKQTFLFGDFADADDHPTTFVAGLHAGGFGYVGDVAGRWAEELVAADPDFAKTTISGNDLPMCDSIDIESVTFDGIELDLTPGAGQVQIQGVIDSNPSHKIAVDFRARDCTFLKVDIPGTVSADEGIFSGGLAVDLVHGQFEVAIVQPAVTLPGYDVDLDTDILGALGEIAQWLTSGVVETAIVDAVEDAAGPALEEQLNALFATHELLTLPQDAGVLAVSISAPTQLGLSVSNAGIILPLETQLVAYTLDNDGNPAPAPKVHDSGGPLWIPDPAFQPLTDWDLQIGLPYNMMNAALFLIWQLGLLDQTLPLGDLQNLMDAAIRDLEEVSIAVVPHLPPVVVPAPEGLDKPAQLQVGGMLLEIQGAHSPDEQVETLALLSLRATAGIGLTTETDGETTWLKLTMDEPKLLVEVVEAIDEEVALAFVDSLEKLGPSLVPMLVEQEAKFPLPSLGSSALSFDALESLNDGGFLHLVGLLPESPP